MSELASWKLTAASSSTVNVGPAKPMTTLTGFCNASQTCWLAIAESLMSAVCFAQPGVSSLAEQSVNQVQLRRA